MAKVTLTELYAQLEDWPGRLLEADGTTVVTTQDPTQFVFEHGAGSDFEGFTVTVNGTGSKYLDGVAIEGTISSVQIRDGSGNLLVSITGLAAGSAISNDLSQFFSNVFGSPDPNAGPGPNGEGAWDLLLAGNDTINGTTGNDWQDIITLNDGNDTYVMRGGEDWIGGSAGEDTYYGGAGFDVLQFQRTTFTSTGAIGGAVFNVEAGTVRDPWGELDRFTGIEAFQGSRFNDVFNGSATRDDEFQGLRGRDRIDGGAKSFAGGQQTSDEWDWVGYRDDFWQGGQFGVVVDLETSFENGSIRGVIRDGFGNRDKVIDIEHVEGTRFDDRFTGSRVHNEFDGGEGQDSYNGASGFDVLNFFNSFTGQALQGIEVDLSLGSGQVVDDGFGNTEEAVNIEGVNGSEENDLIAGNGEDNYISGHLGADTMTGNGGSDTFNWFEEDELGQGDIVIDFSANDVLTFNAGNFTGMTAVRLKIDEDPTTNRGTFIFDTSDHTLYYDEDGTGSADAVAVVVLMGVTTLAVSNFELWD